MKFIFMPSLAFVVGCFFFISCKKEEKLFTLVKSADSGIDFSNRIAENDTMNILSFEYVYNGGGVGLGDFNNDSLVDVYFTGNSVDNKLYLNKGDFRFEEVTQKAGVGAPGQWSTGVALVDINNDGRLDIYVCNSVKKVAEERRNLLYVNQGSYKDNVPVFKEMAEEYGIADTTHTTNAAFFDYDNDGDLDLFLVVNEMDNTYYPNKFHEKIKDGSSRSTDRLYRNDWDSLGKHPVYTNVSKEAGILIEGYGLGVNVTDINQDGWKDIYVTNDYITNDLLYINNGNGTFTDKAEEYFGHTSYSAMGNDVADINNDGLPDIVALDMLPATNRRKKMMTPANSYITYQNNDRWGYQYQVARNTLQLNLGSVKSSVKHPIFGEIGLLSGIAETDWSWTPMVTDFDNDGYRDIIITNGFPKDITDMDFMVYRASVERIMSSSMLLEHIPSVKINNVAYRNNGKLQFDDVTDVWGIDVPSFSNGAAYADLDNDGDLDYIVNNINDSAFVYRNNSWKTNGVENNFLRISFAGERQNRNGIGVVAELVHDGREIQYAENSPYRGYLSSVEPVLHFGLGKVKRVDRVKITWPGGKVQVLKNVSANQVIRVFEKEASDQMVPETEIKPLFEDISSSLSLKYRHEEQDVIDFNTQKLLPHKMSQYGPALAVGDVNNDGLEDVFIGGAMSHKGRFLIQGKDGTFKEEDRLPGANGPEKNTEDMGVLFFDADLDGDLDLYIVSGSYEANIGTEQLQDRFYINDGKGNFRLEVNALPKFLKSGSCVKAADYDRDGDLDLFVGGRVEPGAYPRPVSSYVLRNESQKAAGVMFTEVTQLVAPELNGIGLICDGLWTDVDNDGWVDLLLAGEWMPIRWLKNVNGKFKAEMTGIEDKTGWWNSIAAGDFDNDGDTDYIAGNLGINSFSRVSAEQPYRMYAMDFNKDGFYDAIPTLYYKAADGNFREFPYNNRDEMGKQIIQVRQRFQEYSKFADAGIQDIFKPEELKEALVLSANWMKSSYIENKGNGKFEIKALPIETQTGPLFGMTVNDFDGDGSLDVLLAGNDYGADLGVGRYDAFHGLLLKGDGKSGFTPVRASLSGYATTGDAKSLVNLVYGNASVLTITSQNRSTLCTHKWAAPGSWTDVQADDSFVMIKFKNGKTRKTELNYGSSFLSQSTRKILLPPYATSAEATDSKGGKRKIL
jgi:hypothetical protein